MIKVGITGGIGSGKSIVSKVFEVLGVPVYYADDAAKRLMNTDEGLRQQLTEKFGAGVYDERGLNRKYLSAQVFENTAKLELLNSIVHPATILDAERWMAAQQAPYAIKEAALIFESGSQQYLDLVIGVSAPEALRIQRVMHRDKVTRTEVKNRISKQIAESLKMRLCDYVIKNDDLHPVILQVEKLHAQLLRKATLSSAVEPSTNDTN
ncbi:MAG: dephospho-CoA kinase [Ferruginibacter sp.]|nr:dephospho-CoA kinase [Ferruginibacter sp.]